MKTYNLDNEKIKELGVILNTKRLNKNISLSQLANELEVNAGYITKLEKGSNTKSINILLLKAICEKLDLNYTDLLKKIGYLDNNTFILSTEDIEKVFTIAEDLNKALGSDNPITDKYINYFSSIFTNSLETNIKTFESIEDYDPELCNSEFSINSFIFKGIELKALFKIEPKDKIEDEKYILVKIDNKYCLKKYYLEKDFVILVCPSSEARPLTVTLDSFDYYGTLYQTIKRDLY